MNDLNYEAIFKNILIEKVPSVTGAIEFDDKWINTSSQSCAICCESMQNVSVSFTSCRHAFHTFCIKEWWNIAQNCCFCSKDLTGESLIPATLQFFCMGLKDKNIADIIVETFRYIKHAFSWTYAIELCFVDRVAWVCDSLLEFVQFDEKTKEVLAEVSKVFSKSVSHAHYFEPVSVWKKRWNYVLKRWQTDEEFQSLISKIGPCCRTYW